MNIVENKKSKTIDDIYGMLSTDSQKSLMDYAEFLCQRDGVVEPELEEKLDLPRPQKESVVAALKRLNHSYPMIEKKRVFHEASSLMTDHIMQGRDAIEVIDELEMLFNKTYQDYLLSFSDK